MQPLFVPTTGPNPGSCARSRANSLFAALLASWLINGCGAALANFPDDDRGVKDKISSVIGAYEAACANLRTFDLYVTTETVSLLGATGSRDAERRKQFSDPRTTTTREDRYRSRGTPYRTHLTTRQFYRRRDLR